MTPSHVFYDEQGLLDLRYLVAAEAFEDLREGAEQAPDPYALRCLLDVGNAAQVLFLGYATRDLRDRALQRLTALHQAWDAHAHAAAEEDL